MSKKIKDVTQEEWKDMPEYKLKQHKPIRTIKMNFETEEDLKAFEKLIGQKIHPNRENYWYPQWHESLYSNLVYVDENNES